MNYEIAILYGTQTGTAKFAAEELGREMNKWSYFVKVINLDEYDYYSLPDENFVIFIVSTTGN
jgi:sulfite reductase alpha subunit-like flavoprotein